MSRAKSPIALLVSAIAVAAIVCSATANAAAPVKQGGDPKDPTGPFPAESIPTAAETAGHALAEWIADHPDDQASGGVRVLKDRKTVLVYWKGSVPAALQALAASQPVPITFQQAAYSRAELTAAVKAAMKSPDVSAAGSEPDYSGISVVVSAKAPANAFAQVKAASSIPTTLRWIGDPTPLDASRAQTQTTSSASCPISSRCSDSSPFYGGSLMRPRGVSGVSCSTGASLDAGAYTYMTTDWHCYEDATWVGYDYPSNAIGAVSDVSHIVPQHDFMILSTAANAGRIWTGDWTATTSVPVRGMERPAAATTGPVACSCGVSGNGHYQYIGRDNEMWKVRGRDVGPGFYVEEYPDRCVNHEPYCDMWPATGWTQGGDSGSPIVRGSSYYLIQGFLSAGGYGKSPYCSPGRHPGFDGYQGTCFTEYWASYPDVSIASIGGLHLKTG
jgi:hypothetical protein